MINLEPVFIVIRQDKALRRRSRWHLVWNLSVNH